MNTTNIQRGLKLVVFILLLVCIGTTAGFSGCNDSITLKYLRGFPLGDYSQHPNDVAYMPDMAEILITDIFPMKSDDNLSVLHTFNLAGKHIRECDLNFPFAEGLDFAENSGTLFVSGSEASTNGKIEEFSIDCLSSGNSFNIPYSTVNDPEGVVLDIDTDTLLIADNDSPNIVRMTRSGEYLETIPVTTQLPSKARGSDVEIDPVTGHLLYLWEREAGESPLLLEIDTEGNVCVSYVELDKIIGEPTNALSGDGGIAVHGNTLFYVTRGGGNKQMLYIFKIIRPIGTYTCG